MTEETALKLNDFIKSFKNVIKESEKAMNGFLISYYQYTGFEYSLLLIKNEKKISKLAKINRILKLSYIDKSIWNINLKNEGILRRMENIKKQVESLKNNKASYEGWKNRYKSVSHKATVEELIEHFTK